MRFIETPLPEVLILEPRLHGDERGFFMETYRKDELARAGISAEFVQDNHSSSSRGVLRGLHYQEPFPQGKLVRCIAGTIFDVAVDIRRSSPAFGRWFGAELSAENKLQMWIPPGFAHGFCVTSERAEVLYKCTEVWRKELDRSILWNDAAIGIEWPLADPILSEKDAGAPTLAAALVLPAF
ncbi:MAG TPA: dTDP-4-dehydrorhamnose 3,5-epimerase [Thermoanaerobaculia bacterium]|nr:dTDP-4-dehydrorhamnose 3,5-epimerase [Thermoanaerobaculia bacterium]